MKQNKLKNKKQAHGMVEEFNKPISTINQLLGDTGRSKYRQLLDPFDLASYETYLKNLSESDLREHAADFGIIVTDNRAAAINKLTHEFQLHASQYRQSQGFEKVKVNEPTLADIMKNGR